tara:strand:- start:168 stop:626 length:459 start_codon:yes stop_codon:yes gene_type:complete
MAKPKKTTSKTAAANKKAAQTKKKIKPFKTAAGAVQFMRNFDPDNVVDSTYKEIDKMIAIFRKEHEKLGPKKFKEKYEGKTLMQVEARLDAMREAQLAESYRRTGNEDIAKLYDRFEKKSLDFEKKIGKNKGGLSTKKRIGHTDLRKTGLFR